MAASALTTATAAALTSTLPESGSKSNQQSPRHTPSAPTVAVQTGQVEVSKVLQEGEKFIKWDEVSFLCHSRVQYEQERNFSFVTLSNSFKPLTLSKCREYVALCSLKYAAVIYIVHSVRLWIIKKEWLMRKKGLKGSRDMR